MSNTKLDLSPELFSKLSVLAEEVAAYQSNHYGTYPKERLVAAYLLAPEHVRQLISRSARGLFRGSDLYNNRHNFKDFCSGKTVLALSFSPNKGVASVFGEAMPYRAICESFEGSIDARRLARLLGRAKIAHSVGDDEGEVILLNVKYRQTMKEELQGE